MEEAREYDSMYKQPLLDSPLTSNRFTNKVALVTGGASGIGRAVVERFCNDGASVAILDIDEKLGSSLSVKLVNLGHHVKFYKCDVAIKDQCCQAVQLVADDFGGMIHFLVNSAAYFKGVGVPFLDLTPELLQTTFDVGVIGGANMVQACFPFMKNDGKQCAVVNILSAHGHKAVRNHAAYCSFKSAMNMLTRCMALDLSNHGIRVNSVSPGGVWTPIVNDLFNSGKGHGSTYEDLFCKTLLTPRCLIEAAGIASVVAFLCSKDAMYIDGADIPVDCGYTALGPEGPGY